MISSMLLLVVVFFCSVYVSYRFTGATIRYSLKHDIVDRPNQRSSHAQTTPRGGGLSIVVMWSTTFLASALFDWLPLRDGLALLAAGLIVATIGFLDDYRSLSSRLRFGVHLVASCIGALCVTQLPSLPLPGLLPAAELALDNPLGTVLVVFCLTWVINLYNFMDGIDTLAAIEAITVLGAAAALLLIDGAIRESMVLLLLIAPVIGFLVWNWSPASVFMGDGCSSFLGLSIGLCAIIIAQNSTLNLWCWMILLGVFIVDSSWTLCVRIVTGQDWHSAHRSHSYQILARKYNSHLRVSVITTAINLLWLAPLAWATSRYPALGCALLLLAYAPLVFFCGRLGAGRNR